MIKLIGMRHLKKNNKRGMTLVEIIVSMAVLGILVALFIIAFTSSILIAVNSGDNTNVSADASSITTEVTRDETLLQDEDVDNYVSDPEDITVKFNNNAGVTATVSGKYYTVDTESIEAKDSNRTTIEAFAID